MAISGPNGERRRWTFSLVFRGWLTFFSSPTVQPGCVHCLISAMISRNTFDPPVTVGQLNTRILNVIPDRDYIARIDDPGRLYQRIECRAPAYSLFGCHSMWRSLCEFAYQCWSEGRPILCWCVSKYGYPPPAPTANNTGITWENACANA